MSAAFTGASGQLGSELYRGALAYFAELNADGGVAGRRVRMLAYDDGYTPARAIDNTIALIEQDRVPLLFGYVGTPTVTRVLPLLKRYEDQYISSAGLRGFVMAARALRGKGTLALAAPVPRVQQILDITGIPTLATIYGTASEAVGALKT
jgi:hypothetical protein